MNVIITRRSVQITGMNYAIAISMPYTLFTEMHIGMIFAGVSLSPKCSKLKSKIKILKISKIRKSKN